MAEISVIMLTYNRKEFLEVSIPSVLRQTWTDFEMIIVDNGSNDGSATYCDEWAKKDSRIRVIHRERGTIGAGRNTGLKAVKGNFVTFVDDDDRMDDDMLEFLYRLIQKHQADIAICGSYRETSQGISPKYVYDQELVYDSKEAIHELLARKWFNAGFPTKLFRYKKFTKMWFDEKGKYDDIGACYRFFSCADRIVAKGVPKYYCCRHDGNNSAFTTNNFLLSQEQLEMYLAAFKERTEFLSQRFPDEVSYYRYTEWSYMISMCHKLLITNNITCTKIFLEMKKRIFQNIEEIKNCEYLQEFEREWLAETEKGDI